MYRLCIIIILYKRGVRDVESWGRDCVCGLAPRKRTSEHFFLSFTLFCIHLLGSLSRFCQLSFSFSLCLATLIHTLALRLSHEFIIIIIIIFARILLRITPLLLTLR